MVEVIHNNACVNDIIHSEILRVTDKGSPAYQTDRRTTTKPNISDSQTYDHKAQHIRLTDVRPQSPTYQTDRRTTTKPNISD